LISQPEDVLLYIQRLAGQEGWNLLQFTIERKRGHLQVEEVMLRLFGRVPMKMSGSSAECFFRWKLALTKPWRVMGRSDGKTSIFQSCNSGSPYWEMH
jgi:hypothetical protein